MTGNRFIEAGALVSGSSAWLLSRILASPGVAKVVSSPPVWLDRAEIAATVEAIHRASRAFEAESAALERGNRVAGSAVAAQSEWTTQQAADHLGLSQRRVQEIAIELGGIFVDRRWRIPAATVMEYERMRRRAAA